MNTFLAWWKSSLANMEGLIRAGVAHFYFVTIHPFEDGNGRRLAGKRLLKPCGTSAKP
jgi:Fic family protein